jgi:hypothetical protein
MSEPTGPEPSGDAPSGPPTPPSCCLMRRKVVVGILAVLAEAQCGVADAELADFLRFDLEAPGGKPVLAFRFCPWCGTARAPDAETRIVDYDVLKAEPADDEDGFEPPSDGFEPPQYDPDEKGPEKL